MLQRVSASEKNLYEDGIKHRIEMLKHARFMSQDLLFPSPANLRWCADRAPEHAKNTSGDLSTHQNTERCNEGEDLVDTKNLTS